ncbi:hypothetical protein ACFQV8_12535 [Pseudonocardia benzenivorans]
MTSGNDPAASPIPRGSAAGSGTSSRTVADGAVASPGAARPAASACNVCATAGLAAVATTTSGRPPLTSIAP